MGRRWGCVLVFLAASCEQPHAATRRELPTVPSRRAPAAPLAPIEEVFEEGTRALPVPGFGAAVVYDPGGRGPHSLIVAAHGNYDRPEWQCSVWSRNADGRAFVLCPRGVERPDSPSPVDRRFTYLSLPRFEREVEAALAAFRRTYGSRLAQRPLVYAGFSLGAIFGVDYLRHTSERYGAAVLVEGGHTLWSSNAVQSFASRGGSVVLFACGQASCAREARGVLSRFRGAGVQTEVTLAPGSGHSYAGAVARAMFPAFDRWVMPMLNARSERSESQGDARLQ